MSQFGSPQRERIHRIAEKLTNISATTESERAKKLELLEKRLATVEDKYNDFVDTNNKRLLNIREQVTKVQRLIEENHTHFNIFVETKGRDLQVVDKELLHRLQSIVEARKEGEQRMLRLIDDRVNQIKTDLAKETRIRVESLDIINSTLEEDIPRITNSLKNEVAAKEDSDREITKKIIDEFSKIYSAIEEERKTREETENSMFDMLKEVVGKVKNEIDYEKKNRETTEDNLLNLIEDACSKLNQVSTEL
eukprot:TRINITY_DN1105_c0_g3_i2.p1 TRINITY_DN1105_c0_g3~~TRINITY_DN1105_c0_g3_i2.p1  ORF type:complete len:251 (-),score=71.83 TRINITY_DN1105_c0_g3_i2:103-855(-)